MSNTRPQTYTEAVTVRFTAEQREALRAHAMRIGMAVGGAVREAGLVAIGRKDLSEVEDAPPVDPGKFLESESTPQPYRHGALVHVMMTPAQRRAFDAAAAKRGVTLSALLRDAACKVAKAPAAPPQREWSRKPAKKRKRKRRAP